MFSEQMCCEDLIEAGKIFKQHIGFAQMNGRCMIIRVRCPDFWKKDHENEKAK